MNIIIVIFNHIQKKCLILQLKKYKSRFIAIICIKIYVKWTIIL